MKNIQNYRGVSKAFIVNVLEGNGTEENPYDIKRYILEIKKDGGISTTGKFVPLTEEEQNWINDFKF